MIFQWRWILILLALVLGGEITFAASVAKEQRDFAAAVERVQGRNVIPRGNGVRPVQTKNIPNSTNAPMAVLLQAQAEFKQGEFTNAIALLNDATNLAKAGNLADQYVYWIGRVAVHERGFFGGGGNFCFARAKISRVAVAVACQWSRRRRRMSN